MDLKNKLSGMQGADFDREYMSAMVDDHGDAVRDLRSRVDENRSVTDRLTGKNPESPAAVMILPIVRPRSPPVPKASVL